MDNLIDISSLTIDDINEIIKRAIDFEKGIRKSNHNSANVVTMFFENSTRTKMSFEMAIHKISANHFDFTIDTSSLSKGEDLFDTINNLSAIGYHAVILRHKDNELIKKLSSEKYYNEMAFINAGSGTYSHPTQALLDYYTMKKHFYDLKDKTITIVGDIAHSRVASSNIALFKKMGVKNIHCLAPVYLTGERIEGVVYHTNLQNALSNSDIVMALRIQKERIQESVDIDDYIKNYQITRENLPHNVFLMHPGPVNWGIELSEDLKHNISSQTILTQAKNGVFVRMAVLDILLGKRGL